MNPVVKSIALAAALTLPIAAAAAPAKYRLSVDGLACPFCAYGIEKELTRTKGVNDVEIDINLGVVRVTMNEGAGLTEAQARQIVKDAGFTLADFRKLQ